jgi:hypothetical protein
VVRSRAQRTMGAPKRVSAGIGALGRDEVRERNSARNPEAVAGNARKGRARRGVPKRPCGVARDPRAVARGSRV